jgi:predicted dehydrogenase
MRRYAHAFLQAVAEVKTLGPINYARVRDIIGRNRLFIDQTSTVLRFDDIPPAAQRDRAARAERLVAEAIGQGPADLIRAYRLLLGLSSHDLSAMRELLGVPKRVISAAQWHGGLFLSANFGYDGYCITFETGIDSQRRFDAHLEVYGETKLVKIQYDTPFIRHLPTTLTIQETIGDAVSETVVVPTYTDPYTYELEHFHDVVVGNATTKTTPEDFIEDLRLFREIVEVLRST